MKILIESEKSPASHPDSQILMQRKKPSKSVICKHIAPKCLSFSDAVQISSKRETDVFQNHVFRVSPNSFEYCEKEATFTSSLCPYYKCQRIKNEFRVTELGVMKMKIVENHFRPDLSYQTCIAKFKIDYWITKNPILL